MLLNASLWGYNTSTMNKTSLIGLAATSAMLLSAIPALAATPQQILESNLKALDAKGPTNISAEIKLNVTEKIWATTKTDGPQSTSATFRYDQRSLGEAGNQNSEAKLTITQAEVKDKVQTMKLDQPISMQWKVLMPKIYGQLEQVPESVLGALKTVGVDAAPYVGQWYKIEIPADLMGSLAQITAQSAQAEESLKAMNDIAKQKLVKITYTEKRYKNAKGEQIVRVRIAPNFTYLATLRTAELKEAAKITDRAARTAKVKQINTDYADMIKQLRAVSMVANINVTKQTTERVEFYVSKTDPKKDCTYNSLGKEVCKTIGNTTVTIHGGVNLLAPNAMPIQEPANALTLDAVQGLMQAKQ